MPHAEERGGGGERGGEAVVEEKPANQLEGRTQETENFRLALGEHGNCAHAYMLLPHQT